MSSLAVLAALLVAIPLTALVALVQLARRRVWGRLILVAILTRIFDRPGRRLRRLA